MKTYKKIVMQIGLLLCLINLSACYSPQTKKTETPEPATSLVSSAFIIPTMKLARVNMRENLVIIKPGKHNQLRTPYHGNLFPELHEVEFNAEQLKGFINVSKTINGVKLSKQLINTPLKIINFAKDAKGEIYIITQQHTYKFIP